MLFEKAEVGADGVLLDSYDDSKKFGLPLRRKNVHFLRTLYPPDNPKFYA